jgi:hypothetical protein
MPPTHTVVSTRQEGREDTQTPSFVWMYQMVEHEQQRGSKASQSYPVLPIISQSRIYTLHRRRMALRDLERSDRREDEDEIGKGGELERPFLGGKIKKYQDHPWASYLSARDWNEIQRRARGFFTPRVGLVAISFLLALFIIKDIYLVSSFRDQTPTP